MNKILKLFVLFSIVGTSFIIQSEAMPNLDMRSNNTIEAQAINFDQIFTNIKLTDNSLLLIVISVELTILMVLSLYWRKERVLLEVNQEKKIKKNINAIRNENLLNVGVEYPNKFRRSLSAKINSNILSDKNFAKKAKKLSVAKGELLLAAKLQQLQGQQR